METVKIACPPVKRPLRCTAHVAVTLGSVQFCRSPKVLKNICGSTAAINIFTFACGKRKSPGLPHLLVFPRSTPPHSNRILTRVACAARLVAIDRHNGVGRTVAMCWHSPGR